MPFIYTYEHPALLEEQAAYENYVVIDVLRATTVMAQALQNGARRIIPVQEIEQATALKTQYDPVRLCGERKGLKIRGFDCGNSPLEMTRQTVEGHTLIMTTTNGTRALKKCPKNGRIFICALVNLQATADYLISLGGSVCILCAGTQGKYSYDDIYTAGALADALGYPCGDDLSYTALSIYRQEGESSRILRENCAHYRYLESIGMKDDLRFALSRDIVPVVGEYVGDEILRI